MRRFGVLMIFVFGLSVGYVAHGAGRKHTTVHAADAPFADRIVVTQPDPAAPGGRTSHLMHVEEIGERNGASADRTDPRVWIVTLIQDAGDDSRCVTYTAE